MKPLFGAVVAAALTGACGGSTPPAAPTPLTSVPPAASPPAPSPPAAAAFVIDLPLTAGDAADDIGGITPFGVHLADHGVDGHPGWDFQYRIGGLVRAAADGVVQTVTVPEPQRPGRYVIQVRHETGGRSYRTVYFGVADPQPGIVAGAAIRRGDTIGTAAVLTQVIGTTNRTYALIHFQVDDFSYSNGLTNLNAVNPGLFLTPGATALFTTLWNSASYSGELTEPFPSNPRGATFPLTRTWTRQRGEFAEVLELTRPTGTTNDYSYRLLDADRRVIESGTARSAPFERPFPTLDLIASSGALRRGLYDVVDNTMRLAVAAAGAARPVGFGAETIYTTTGSSSMTR